MSQRPIVLFGNGVLARTFHAFLTLDGSYDVVATTVDGDHVGGQSALDLPNVAFEDVTSSYPPDDFDMFIGLGYLRMNTVRRDRYEQAKAMGYRLISHVSRRASTWPDLQVGDNCLILDGAIVHPFVSIGNDCIIWSGAHIGHGSTVADHCFIASRAALSGDVTVGERAFLGTNCTIRDGIAIAPASAIGAGVVITRDTAPGGIYAPPTPRVLPGTSDRLPRF
jgi:sugar O-acyltransferase (sialic acid O-acetyltransferase NeuD family)